MAKRKKTKEQKILAEIRRKEQVVSPGKALYSLNNIAKHEDKKVVNSERQNLSAQDHHLSLDLRKTILATCIILLLELGLRIFIFKV